VLARLELPERGVDARPMSLLTSTLRGLLKDAEAFDCHID
jgi:hypothetical protein